MKPWPGLREQPSQHVLWSLLLRLLLGEWPLGSSLLGERLAPICSSWALSVQLTSTASPWLCSLSLYNEFSLLKLQMTPWAHGVPAHGSGPLPCKMAHDGTSGSAGSVQADGGCGGAELHRLGLGAPPPSCRCHSIANTDGLCARPWGSGLA